MDIASFTPGERIIEIVSPDKIGRPLGIRISLISLTDERMKKIKKSIIDRRMYLEARGKNFKADDLEENRNNITFGAMTGWQWYKINKDGVEDNEAGEQTMFQGKVPNFNKPEVCAVFDKLPWFRDQIDEAIAEEKDFFPT